MGIFEHPEINALNDIYVKHKFEFRSSRTEFLGGKPGYRAANFKLAGKSFDIFIDDELEDLRYNYPLLNLCLVLRELEDYQYADDYLLWCKERYFDPADEQIRNYHKHLGEVYKEIEQILGKVDSKVSDWDFEMGSGAAHELRKRK